MRSPSPSPNPPANDEKPKPKKPVVRLDRNAALFQIEAAAMYCGVCRSTIYESARAGELEIGKFKGRSVIKRECLDAYISKNYRAAG